ncbi:MAG: phosphonopyruvate decarboxylase [Pseudomonadota bacterium]
MLQAETFFAAFRDRGIRRVTGTPCSYLAPLINAAIVDPSLEFRAAANEGDAVAFAAGGFVGSGEPEIVMFQNSGLGNAVNALTSLNWPFRIPSLLVVTHRGDPRGPADEPQHELMGAITLPLLALLRIPWVPFPPDRTALEAVLQRVTRHFATERLPFALVMPRDGVAGPALQREYPPVASGARRLVFEETLTRIHADRALRAEALGDLLALMSPDDLVVATTGYTGRELFTLRDAPNHLYLVGAMGGASAFGLGLALRQPQRRVFVIDGDGALMMRLGNLAAVGAHAPPNLFHLVLDNAAHESTGGQATAGGNVWFGAMAQAAGYARVAGSDDRAELTRAVATHTPHSGPTLLHFRIRVGALPRLARPTLQPVEVRRRLMTHLGLTP